jgi:hypothetical protein
MATADNLPYMQFLDGLVAYLLHSTVCAHHLSPIGRGSVDVLRPARLSIGGMCGRQYHDAAVQRGGGWMLQVEYSLRVRQRPLGHDPGYFWDCLLLDRVSVSSFPRSDGLTYSW